MKDKTQLTDKPAISSNGMLPAVARHKWIKDNNGKYCSKCGSRVNTAMGLVKYLEIDKYGIAEGVNWYPRCNSR